NIKVVGADRETTTIDGDSSGTVITFNNGEDSTAVLSGFTLQNGSGTSNGSYIVGGGVYIYSNDTQPTLKDLKIRSNTASQGGGVFIDYYSGVYLSNCQISNNTAGYGAGIGMVSSNVSNPIISLENVQITNNTASQWSGGISMGYSSPILKNCIISDNVANGDKGGGITTTGGNPVFVNTAIVNNSCSGNGGAVYFDYGHNLTLVNSIIWENSPNNMYFSDSNDPSTVTISYSNIEGGQDSIVTNGNGTVTWGNGNIDVDAHFLDAENNDYHLLASSQCINGGHPDSLDSDGTVSDMGPYPYLNTYSGPTWYITESGNDTTATGASDDPFRSIQAGINFSSDADSVTVAS
ncbi:uncharacterized protein METZ01_LOCUS260542, partial [marine metagenome]